MNAGILGIAATEFAGPLPLLGRPTPIPMPDSGRYLHPEAEDWRLRVIRNGGGVSSATLMAVSAFCQAISSAVSLRAKLYRLNLLCGSGLQSCLVPLYRGPSLSGAQLGGETDVNSGPFVRADYQEFGEAGGLRGNGATKFLNTVYAPGYSANTSHLSVSAKNIELAGSATMIGAESPSQSYIAYTIDGWSDSNSGRVARIGGPTYTPVPSSTSEETHLCAVKVNNETLVYYRSGKSVGNGGTSAGAMAGAVYVFASNRNGAAANFSGSTMRMYSMGTSLTAAEALALGGAVVAFNFAMGRV